MAYSTAADLIEYAADRGITINGDPAQLLTLAHDYTNSQSFIGTKADPLQSDEWPRTGAYMGSYLIPSDVIPDFSGGYSVVRMELETALAIDAGNNPAAPIERKIESKSESVDTLSESITYAEGSAPYTLSPAIRNAGGRLLAGTGFGFKVVNA